MEPTEQTTGATGPAPAEETRIARSPTQRLTRTVHARPTPVFGELLAVAPDLQVTVHEGEPAPHVIGFRDPDGEAHYYVVSPVALSQLVLAIIPTFSDEQRAVVLETLTGVVLAGADALPT